MKKKNRFLLSFLLGLAAVAAGCAGAHYSLVPDYRGRIPRSIAIMPVLNEAVNLRVGEEFRPLLHQKVALKGYEALALSTIDGRLLEKGIREPGQVHSLTAQELGKLLGTDALLYTTVTEFNTAYLVAYSSITVGARFELRDSRSGEKLWESDHEVKERKLGVDKSSARDAASFAALRSYHPYIQQVINASFATLPDGPNAPGAPSRGSVLPAGGK